MHNQTSDPASRILKYVSSAVHQADVLQYDSKCSFAELSAELWGRCVLNVHSSEPTVPGQGWRWGDRVTRICIDRNKACYLYNIYAFPSFLLTTWKSFRVKKDQVTTFYHLNQNIDLSLTVKNYNDKNS